MASKRFISATLVLLTAALCNSMPVDQNVCSFPSSKSPSAIADVRKLFEESPSIQLDSLPLDTSKYECANQNDLRDIRMEMPQSEGVKVIDQNNVITAIIPKIIFKGDQQLKDKWHIWTITISNVTLVFSFSDKSIDTRREVDLRPVFRGPESFRKCATATKRLVTKEIKKAVIKKLKSVFGDSCGWS